MFGGGVKSPGRPFDLRKLMLPIQYLRGDEFDIRNTFQKDLPDRILVSSCHDQIREGWNTFDRRQHSEGFIFDLMKDIRRNAINQYETIHPFGKEDRRGPGDSASHRISDQSGLLNPHPGYEIPQTMNVGLRGVRNLWPVRE